MSEHDSQILVASLSRVLARLTADPDLKILVRQVAHIVLEATADADAASAAGTRSPSAGLKATSSERMAGLANGTSATDPQVIFPEESAQKCREMGLRMTVDISHTRLAANHFGFDFYEGIALLGPYTAHYHLGDSKGVDGEGLQIGAGDIDFDKLGAIMKKHAPDATFIPEIWQGHKNFGQDFWVALERLEGKL